MLEVRPYDGDASELARFIQRHWRTSYEGRVLIPLWSENELKWHFFENPYAVRDYMLGAYHAGRLVGAFFASAATFRLQNQLFEGSYGSWLTVDPSFRNSLVAPSLISEMLERHRLRGARCIFGLGFPSGAGMSLEFWEAFAKAYPNLVEISDSIGYWLRVIDSTVILRHCLLAPWERAVVRATSWQRRPRSFHSDGAIDKFRDSDVGDCLELITTAANQLELTPVWLREPLCHHLGAGCSEALVWRAATSVGGVISYYRQDILGERPFAVGMIEELAARSTSHATKLLRTALKSMDDSGVSAAIATADATRPKVALLNSGFIPFGFGHRLILVRIDPALRLPVRGKRQLHLH